MEKHIFLENIKIEQSINKSDQTSKSMDLTEEIVKLEIVSTIGNKMV